MNRKRAVRAAGAGLVATGVFLAALLILGAAVFFGLELSTGASWVAALAVFALVALGGALPARALGAGWRRSLLVSGAVMGPLALAAPFLAANAEGLFVLFCLFAFAAPTLISTAASAGNGLSFASLASVVAVAALFFVVSRLTGFFSLPGMNPTSAAFVESAVVVAAGWALLPSLAGLFQSRELGVGSRE